MFVIVAGNPFDGLQLWGPFEDGNDAGDWAERELATDGEVWWILKLTDPADQSPAEQICKRCGNPKSQHPWIADYGSRGCLSFTPE